MGTSGACVWAWPLAPGGASVRKDIFANTDEALMQGTHTSMTISAGKVVYAVQLSASPSYMCTAGKEEQNMVFGLARGVH